MNILIDARDQKERDQNYAANMDGIPYGPSTPIVLVLKPGHLKPGHAIDTSHASMEDVLLDDEVSVCSEASWNAATGPDAPCVPWCEEEDEDVPAQAEPSVLRADVDIDGTVHVGSLRLAHLYLGEEHDEEAISPSKSAVNSAGRVKARKRSRGADASAHCDPGSSPVAL